MNFLHPHSDPESRRFYRDTQDGETTGDSDVSEVDSGEEADPESRLDRIEANTIDDTDNHDDEGSGPPEDVNDQPDQPIGVSISDNGMEAYVVIRVNRHVARSSIMKALESKGVVYGINEDAITELCAEDGPRGFPSPVAKGDRQGAGVNAVLDLYFERAPKPVITFDDNGQADYKESGIIQQVKNGALLAKKTPPERGASGISVTGKEMPGRMGRDLQIIAGVGSKFEDQDGLHLIAVRSGVVSLHKGNEISVYDEYVIEGDVDFSTGNIRFDGAVVVRGNVLSGFKVVASGDIEVKGVVEDADIHCGGNLQIRGGFLGKGKGIARVCGETHIRFLENQTVICNNDIYVAEEIIFSNVTCGGQLMVKFGKGAVIGGVVNARHGIQVKVAGNLHHQKTTMKTGKHKLLSERFRLAVDPIAEKVVMKDRMQLALDSLVKCKYARADGLDTDEQKAMELLYLQMAGIDEWVEEIVAIRDQLDRQINELESQAYVRIEQRIYSGVSITIGDRSRVIDEETPRVEYRLMDGEVIGSTAKR